MNDQAMQTTDTCPSGECAPEEASQANRELTRVRPRADLSEAEDRFQLELDLPGVQPDDLDVSFENRVLTVKGERRDSKVMSDGSGTRRREFSALSFERAFELSEDIDADGIQARHEAGVLTLTLPKAQAAARREIEIRTA